MQIIASNGFVTDDGGGLNLVRKYHQERSQSDSIASIGKVLGVFVKVRKHVACYLRRRAPVPASFLSASLYQFVLPQRGKRGRVRQAAYIIFHWDE